ncbi:hypothetical protein A9K97_gp065 [Tokyovirus A1]|uniref:hypothetical protein n=1 Tax=Tokyovirus A1 TaxID=1826170 RepID=UPI0007A978DA|nr:hypothetical protein A9K97_gp065 [Tokyovirus A1]BAU80286.1 hypothetical protein [Tokyovirus A1]
MSLCVAEPFSLTLLAAFAVVEHSLDREDVILDELSKEAIKIARFNFSSPHVLYRLGKSREYITKYELFVVDIEKLYQDIRGHKYEEELSLGVLNGLPTLDVVSKSSQETKDALFGLFLFWDKLPIEKVSESLFDVLCE